MMSGKIALITGSTGGLGTEFAKIHASREGNLVLVSRDEKELQKQKRELESKYNIKVLMTIAIDLSKENAAEEIYEKVKSDGIEVEYLFNNAGFGGRGEFHVRTMEQDISMLMVNCLTPTKLMKLYLPDFVKRGHGKVLNTASTAAVMPGPLQSEYYATKAYMKSLGNGIWQELQGTGVTCTTLMPGAMKTKFISSSDMSNTKLFAHPVEPYDVALAGYNAMMKGKLNVTAGLRGIQKFVFPLMKLAPTKIMLKSIYNMQLEEKK